VIIAPARGCVPVVATNDDDGTSESVDHLVTASVHRRDQRRWQHADAVGMAMSFWGMPTNGHPHGGLTLGYTFTPQTTLAVDSFPRSVTTVDVNGDGGSISSRRT
jgi:hypothetical protein